MTMFRDSHSDQPFKIFTPSPPESPDSVDSLFRGPDLLLSFTPKVGDLTRQTTRRVTPVFGLLFTLTPGQFFSYVGDLYRSPLYPLSQTRLVCGHVWNRYYPYRLPMVVVVVGPRLRSLCP